MSRRRLRPPRHRPDVRARAPPPPQLRDMFAGFLVDGVADPNLTVDDRLVETPGRGPRRRRRPLHGDDDAPRGPEGPGRRARAPASASTARGELLTTVLPLVDRVAVRGGAAMVHAATVEHEGHGVLLAGTGGAGKTSTVAKLVQGGDTRPMGDDWAFLVGRRAPARLRQAAARPAPPPQPVPAPLQARHEEEADDPARAGRPHGPPGHGGAPDDRPLSARRARAAALVARAHDGGAPGRLPADAGREPRPRWPRRSSSSASSSELVTAEQVDAAWMAARLLGNFHDELPRFSKALLDKLCATGLDAQHAALRREGARSSRTRARARLLHALARACHPVGRRGLRRDLRARARGGPGRGVLA